MKILPVLLAGSFFSFSSFAEEATPNFDELEYFNKDLISRSKIFELKLSIRKHKAEDILNTDSHSCIIKTYIFDNAGNMTRYDLNRTGSYNYYHYDNDGKLYDWGWKDKSSGKIESIAKTLRENGEDDEAERNKMETALQSALDSRTNYKTITTRAVQDVCYSINANYEITHENSGALPKRAVARRISEVDGHMPDDHKSAETLYIYYDYVFHQ